MNRFIRVIQFAISIGACLCLSRLWVGPSFPAPLFAQLLMTLCIVAVLAFMVFLQNRVKNEPYLTKRSRQYIDVGFVFGELSALLVLTRVWMPPHTEWDFLRVMATTIGIAILFLVLALLDREMVMTEKLRSDQRLDR